MTSPTAVKTLLSANVPAHVLSAFFCIGKASVFSSAVASCHTPFSILNITSMTMEAVIVTSSSGIKNVAVLFSACCQSVRLDASPAGSRPELYVYLSNLMSPTSLGETVT